MSGPLERVARGGGAGADGAGWIGGGGGIAQ